MCQSIFVDGCTTSFAAFQANVKNEPGILKEVAFKVLAFRSVADNIHYKVNLHAVDNESKSPGELLVDHDFMVSWKPWKSKTIRIDVDDFNVNISKKGFYVTIECVGNFDRDGNEDLGNIGYRFAKPKTEAPNSFSKYKGQPWKPSLFLDRRHGNYSNLNVWSVVEF